MLNAFSSNNNSKRANSGSMTGAMKGALAGLGGRANIIAFVLLALVVLIIIIVYIVYKIRHRNLQSVIIVRGSQRLYDMEENIVFEKSKISPTTNGQEYTYSFWIYLRDYDETSQTHRPLFMRSNDNSYSGANPVVFLDGRTNRLYFSARTNQSVEQISSLDEFLPGNDSGYLTAVVEYIPMQRWVNIITVVQDNLMTIYLDGSMYTVKNVHDMWDESSSSKRPVLSGTSGDIYVGPRNSSETETNGYISYLRFYNYALMQDDVQSLYMDGPNPSNLLGSLGVPSYGVRSPIYRLE